MLLPVCSMLDELPSPRPGPPRTVPTLGPNPGVLLLADPRSPQAVRVGRGNVNDCGALRAGCWVLGAGHWVLSAGC